ncbi:unnamed protein product, partial [Tetraodon nigroviridis]
ASVDVKPDVPLSVEPLSPLDLRTDLRMLGPGSDPGLWERQLQQELLLIQKQQQIQKQLLISEFQKQHEKLTRQHQAQLQEHLKELQAMKKQQELAEKERRLEQQQQQQQQQNQQEKEQERHRREQHVSSLILRGKERSRESAVASTEVKQKLQEFLLSKSAKDPVSNGVTNSMIHHQKLWYTSSHHTSLDQSSPPLGGTSPSCQYTLPSPIESKDDFPLRKTASEPNLKVRSRLKQKVAERRSSPMLKRRDGNIMTPYKKRALELMDSTPTNSAPGSGPSSPIGASSALGAENGPSSLPTTTKTERQQFPWVKYGPDIHTQVTKYWFGVGRINMAVPKPHAALLLCWRWPSQPRLFRPEGSVSMLSLYTSPSLPNISFGISTASSPISVSTDNPRVLRQRKADRPGVQSEPKSPGAPAAPPPEGADEAAEDVFLCSMSSHPLSPLAMKDRPSSRAKISKHRPLNMTQSAPLPQNTLAQLVIQHNTSTSWRNRSSTSSRFISIRRDPEAHAEQQRLERRAPRRSLRGHQGQRGAS